MPVYTYSRREEEDDGGGGGDRLDDATDALEVTEERAEARERPTPLGEKKIEEEEEEEEQQPPMPAWSRGWMDDG